MTDTYDYSGYAEVDKDSASLEDMAELAARMRREEAEVEKLSRELKEAQKKLTYTSEVEIPEAMEKLGLSKFETKSGLVITVKQKLFGSLPKDPVDRVAALAWITENGYEYLIKDSFNLAFDRGSRERADELAANLGKMGLEFNRKEDIHHSTLRGFINEMLKDGETVPLELLGVTEKRVTVIK